MKPAPKVWSVVVVVVVKGGGVFYLEEPGKVFESNKFILTIANS